MFESERNLWLTPTTVKLLGILGMFHLRAWEQRQQALGKILLKLSAGSVLTLGAFRSAWLGPKLTKHSSRSRTLRFFPCGILIRKWKGAEIEIFQLRSSRLGWLSHWFNTETPGSRFRGKDHRRLRGRKKFGWTNMETMEKWRDSGVCMFVGCYDLCWASIIIYSFAGGAGQHQITARSILACRPFLWLWSGNLHPTRHGSEN